MKILRIALAVVAGYAVMFAASIAGIVFLWALLGAEGAFRAESTVASPIWSVANCVFGLGASVAGGFVAVRVAKQKTHLPEVVLAVLVLALGLVMAVNQLGSEPPPLPEGKAVGDLTFVEAGGVAVSPTWYNFSIPWIGAVGVMLGASFRRFTG